MLSRQRDEVFAMKAFMPNIERMAQRTRAKLRGKKLQERVEVLCIELFGRHELPQDRSQFGTEFRQSAAKK